MPVRRLIARTLCFTAPCVVGCVAPGLLFAQPAATATTTEDASVLAEIAFWESVQDSRNPEELQAYLAAYPQGRFAVLARVRLAALTPRAADDQDSAAADARRADVRNPPFVDEPTAAPDTPDALKPGTVFRDCAVCPQLTVIPAGRFDMGADDRRAEERPRHAVTIERPFALGVFELRVDEWSACVTDGACRQRPEPGRDAAMPMSNLSWDDAQAYLAWLSAKTGRGYRLPTEAEWEYAARAETATAYWWGEEPGANRANCSDCAAVAGGDQSGTGAGDQSGATPGADASPVGSFEPNPFGLYDVHGNLWEWTQDCWNESYRDAPVDGTAWEDGDCLSRVLRGGSWALDHDYMRASRRHRYDRDVRYYLHGLRVARVLAGQGGAATPDDLLPFDTAVQQAVNKVFAKAPAAGGEPQSYVIDPLIDGLSGMQSAAARAMQSRIVELVRADHGQLRHADFSAADAADARYLVMGTFTGVNKQRKPSGDLVAFRICLRLLDLETDTVVSGAKVFAQGAGVDHVPTGFFRDSPAWMADPSTQAQIETCQGTRPGDPIPSGYRDQIRAAGVLDDAIDAYEQGRYEQARELFERALQTPGGKQLRTYNGRYLASWRLDDREHDAEAFREMVAYGLDSGRLAVEFPFRKAAVGFALDPNGAGQPDVWLAQIAKETAGRDGCFDIVGHQRQSDGELEPRSLAVERADYIRRRLVAEVPALGTRLTAAGNGHAANPSGSATGVARAALDEPIEFLATECPAPRS